MKNILFVDNIITDISMIILLGAVFVALIANRPAMTIHSLWVVAPRVRWVVQQISFTHEVLPHTVVTMPIFSAVVRVGVPSVKFVTAVHGVIARFGRGRSLLTVVVALITHRTFATFHAVGIVTPHVVNVINKVVLTQVVLSSALRTVPIFPTVVRVSVPAVG